MYYVAGSNLFGQWMGDKIVINNFTRILGDKDFINKVQHDAELLCVSWSYNIFKSDNKIFILGMWNGKEKQCEEIFFPHEDTIFPEDLVVGGNDYHIIFVNKISGSAYVFNLESSEWKKTNLKTETPTETKSKRAKHANIFKIAVFNDTMLYLNDQGHVYSGLLPSYVDTSHCNGKIADVQCGYEHNLLLTDTGSVYSWGNGRRLQLGHEGICDIELPTLIEALAGIKIKKIAAGGWHSLALSETGDLYAWGWNDSGQLGILEKDTSKAEPLKTYAVPTLVDFFGCDGGNINIDVRDMACGTKHSVALLEDSTVWVTGNNKYGQLGLFEERPHLCHDQIFNNSLIVHHFRKCITLSDKGINVKELRCGQWSTILSN